MSKTIDIQSVAEDIASGDKYKAEANQVKELLKEHKTDEAADRLRLDAQMAPHEFHKFIASLQKECKGVPDCSITDDKNGIAVTAKITEPNGETTTRTLLERSAKELAKANDQIPRTGDLLGLSSEQTKKILDIQASEKAVNAGASHKFGDIAVSLGYSTASEVNDALRKQDRMAADQIAGDVSRLMPLARTEGYFQALKRTHPEIPDDVAAKFASHMREINNNREILNVAEQLPIISEKEKENLAGNLYEQRAKATGIVNAQKFQPLSEIPF